MEAFRLPRTQIVRDIGFGNLNFPTLFSGRPNKTLVLHFFSQTYLIGEKLKLSVANLQYGYLYMVGFVCIFHYLSNNFFFFFSFDFQVHALEVHFHDRLTKEHWYEAMAFFTI